MGGVVVTHDDELPPCVVCRRRPKWPVCDTCRAKLFEQLGIVRPLTNDLPYALVPGSTDAGQRGGSATEAAPPVRMDALNLSAGGGDDARCLFVPKVRVWSTTEPVTLDDGTQASVAVWHREAVVDGNGRPVMSLVDDQADCLPVEAWLTAWEADWRHEFGHPARVRAPERLSSEPSRATVSVRTLLGIGPAKMPTERPLDPVAAEWDMRWAKPTASDTVLDAVSYLFTWLDYACDTPHPRIVEFAAGLRSLVVALKVATGRMDELEYLGRCPEMIGDRRSGSESVCGASLWHDAQHATITCPRCHTYTGSEGYLSLGRRMLETWPIDRRRRYPRGLIDTLTLPTCERCMATVAVQWLPATERGDREPFWRPGRVWCPACDGGAP